MAFSFHIGTKWCHDFPKLARESGFYFNTHKSKVRIDWNCISNIDVDRIIRERDFYTIDGNINIVIDYCLESEYDVKILDSNFVKLFRLAQLAVEYLLYCKQYLDHSVIILKDELRSKIEENVKLKKEINSLEEMIKHLKEKTKERNRLIETKIGDCNGEIYKCPHCPKTFISSMFVSAHIVRRHAYASDMYVPASPIHEHYRNETEKLHNEIKNLKERLNETEKVIRNESEKITDKKAVEHNNRQFGQEIEKLKHNTNIAGEYEDKGYQEEIKKLKTMLFDEIQNLRQKETTMYEHKAETNVQTLIYQQEKEFQKLKNQLLEKLTPDIESMHAKLCSQESYWKSKIEQLENQHQKDIENLTMELKLTQKTADNMKAEYESKVNDLERRAANQSNILTDQSKQLHSLSNEVNVSQLNENNNDCEIDISKKYNHSVILNKSNQTENKSIENDLKEKAYSDIRTRQIIVGNINSIMNSDHSNKEILLARDNKLAKNVHTLKFRTQTVMCENKKGVNEESIEAIKDKKFYNENPRNDISESENLILDTRSDSELKQKRQDLITESVRNTSLDKFYIHKLEDTSHRNIHQDYSPDLKNSKTLKVLTDDLATERNSDLSISNSQTHSETESNSTICNAYSLHKRKIHTLASTKPRKSIRYNSFYKKLQMNLKDVFEQKLRDLGIDPEWQGIPKATLKQKMDILKHHQKIVMKKLPKYHQIKLQIIKDINNIIFKNEKGTENHKHSKKSQNKLVTNVSSITAERFNDQKDLDHTFTLQHTTSNNSYSTLESDHSVKGIIDNKSSIQSPKATNITERLKQLSPNVIKSLENAQHTINLQKCSIERNPLSKVKSIFNSEQIKVALHNKGISNNKLIKNNSMENLNAEQDLQNVSISPKHNKSVLKSTTGSISSLTKKKVIFDLESEDDQDSSNYDLNKEESNDNNWNSQNTVDVKNQLSGKEVHKYSDNIILKTAQSDKIAEISRKLEAQLNMVRQKPVGSVETIFVSKDQQDKEIPRKDNEIRCTDVNSSLENPVNVPNSKLTNDLLPISHNIVDKVSEVLYVESISNASDLDSDIDRILKLE